MTIVDFLLVISVLIPNTSVNKISLPEGELHWSTTRPKNVKMCVPAAFSDSLGNVLGEYRINDKIYNSNRKLKISLTGNSFSVGKTWKSSEGFQQLVLVNNNKVSVFKDNRKCFRRALCKSNSETFILESNIPLTLDSFAEICKQYCNTAIYLDMGEYGYGYCNGQPLFLVAIFSKHKQTNWIYIK